MIVHNLPVFCLFVALIKAEVGVLMWSVNLNGFEYTEEGPNAMDDVVLLSMCESEESSGEKRQS